MFFLRKKSKSVLFFLVCSNFSLAVPEFQSSPTSELSERRIRFDKLEQRAVRLSQQIGKLSATDPIILIDRNASLEQVNIESDAQRNFDALPGPFVEPLTLVPPKEEANSSVIFNSKVKNVVPTTQQRKGDYYLMPVLGISLSSYIAYEFNQGGTTFSDDLDGGWGNSIGIILGKRWDNWTAFCRFGYQYQKYDNDKFGSIVPGTFAELEASNESYILNLGSGYSIPLSTNLSTYGNVGIGFAYRKDSVEGELYRLTGGSRLDLGSVSDFESSLIFSYDFSMGLEYLFVNNFSARLGYRLLGLTSNESFEGSFQHLIELGVGANF